MLFTEEQEKKITDALTDALVEASDGWLAERLLDEIVTAEAQKLIEQRRPEIEAKIRAAFDGIDIDEIIEASILREATARIQVRELLKKSALDPGSATYLAKRKEGEN